MDSLQTKQNTEKNPRDTFPLDEFLRMSAVTRKYPWILIQRNQRLKLLENGGDQVYFLLEGIESSAISEKNHFNHHDYLEVQDT